MDVFLGFWSPSRLKNIVKQPISRENIKWPGGTSKNKNFGLKFLSFGLKFCKNFSNRIHHEMKGGEHNISTKVEICINLTHMYTYSHTHYTYVYSSTDTCRENIDPQPQVWPSYYYHLTLIITLLSEDKRQFFLFHSILNYLT